MTTRRVKTPPKIFTSNIKQLEDIIIGTIDKIDSIVGCSLGPGGRNVIIESDLPGIPNKNTKDGVSIFRSLGSNDAYEHLIIEQTRDVAIRTVNEAGDGPQPMYSQVLTPTGFVSMSDVYEGMDICGTDGSIQKVLGIFPKGEKEIYEVKFLDGRVVECCADHLWTVTTHYGSTKTLTTSSIMKDFVSTTPDGYKTYRYYCPVPIVNFHENTSEMPLDPYLVGVLLGDGSLSKSGSIELSLGVKKKHILDKIKLPDGLVMNVSFMESKNYYRAKISGLTKDGNKTAHQVVESIGLLNTNSKSKFIPKSYLYASESTRKALLQGLIDTDGHINSRNRFEFSTVSDELCNDFLELARSLGIPMYYKLHTRENDSASYSNTPIHRIAELAGFKHGIQIVDVVPTGKYTQMQCIKVSNKNHLYITDNYIPTHNTTSSTIIAAAFIRNLFAFCNRNRKYSPQKVTRIINKIVKDELVPQIREASIKINNKNKNLLEKVATVSVNGDTDMAKAVMEAFNQVGFGSSSHVTIQELSGPSRYEVEKIEGFPIAKGYEESIGKFHAAFINDQGHQRCVLDKPLFILFDGKITDMVQIIEVLNHIGDEYTSGNSEFANVVIVAHSFSDQVLTQLSFNFNNPATINVVPLSTPMNQIINSQLHFLMDLSAFTGATIFDMSNPISEAQPTDFGQNMEKIEIYRFRTTVVGDPDPLNIETRAEEIQTYIDQSESKIEKIILEERLGKLTSGIAKLKIFGSSNAELKEKADRAEDAVCAVRATLTDGCLPGGCRVLVNLALSLAERDDAIIREIMIPSLFAPFYRLLDNAGYNEEEIEEVLDKMINNKKHVYDVENGVFGDPKQLGIFDATLAVEQALLNAVSISSIIGTMGGMVCEPRDNALEAQDFKDSMNFQRSIDHAENIRNEANERF